MNGILSIFIVLPIVSAFLIPLFNRVNRKMPDIIGNLTVFCLLASAIGIFFLFQPGFVVVYHNLVLDGLSHLLIITINLIACMVAFYSINYMERYTGKSRYYALFMLMLAGMNGVVLAGDFILLFIFLELAATASSALVGFGTQAEEMEASLKYLIMGSVASLFILFGIALLYGLTGAVNMADIARILQQTDSSWPRTFIIVLFLLGFGTKAAIVPFHSWLPDAHPSAPAPISAMLSGVLIKALGVYALVRIIYNVMGMTPQVSTVLMMLGTVSMLVGVLLAIGQWDFKRLLACHSISQIGYVVLGIGIATPIGVMGGLFHLFNHAIFKSLLFLNAGAVEYTTGTRDLRKMGGLANKMPINAVTSLAASLSISGIPPFNGFWSKLFIILACVQSGKLLLAFACAVGSLLTLASFLKVQKYAFFDNIKVEFENIREVPAVMWFPMVIMALLCLIMGIFFQYSISIIINPAVQAVARGVSYGRIVMGGL